MAYTIVPEVIEGDSWTAKDMNRYVKDNFAAGVPGLFTAKGDIAVATGADAAARIGVGTDGDYLYADSANTNGVVWSSPIRVLAYAADYSYIDDSSWTEIDLTETDDTTGSFANNCFTPYCSGFYYISIIINCIEDDQYGLQVHSDPNYAKFGIFKNGELYSVISLVSTYDNTTSFYRATGSDILYLLSTDNIYLKCYHRGYSTYLKIHTGSNNSVLRISSL
jgi:hypothetical protein